MLSGVDLWRRIVLDDDVRKLPLLPELPGVTQLTLHLCKVPRNFFHDSENFRRAPATAILSLCDTKWSDAVLRDLAEDEDRDAGQVLPHLGCLELTALNEEKGYMALLRFLEKRKSFVHPLKEVRLGEKLQSQMGAEFLGSLGEFVEVLTA